MSKSSAQADIEDAQEVRPPLDTTNVEDITDAPQTFKEKVKKYSVIEPFLFLLMIGVSVRMTVDAQLLFVKACVTEKGLERGVCAALTKENNETLFTEVETIATNFIAICMYMGTIPAGVISILVGSFSDKYGRRLLLLVAGIGSLLELVGMICSVLYFESSLWWIVAAKLVSGITGGMGVSMVVSFAYLTTNTAPKNRATRFAVVQTIIVVGMTGGMILSGLIFSNNYLTIYAIAAGAVCLAVAVVLWRMNEGPSKMKDMTFCQLLREFFSIGAVKESCKVVAKPRHGNHRMQIWIIMAQLGFVTLAMLGTAQQTQYYTMRRYGWDANTFSFVIGIFRLISAFVTAFGIRIFTKFLKLHDHTLAIVAMLSQATEYVVCGLAPTSWMFTAGYTAGSLGGMTNISLRSYLTRLLEVDEIGRAFVMFSMVDIAVPLVATKVFADVYTLTKQTVVGAMFFISASLLVIPILLSLWMRIWGVPPSVAVEGQAPADAITSERIEEGHQNQPTSDERSGQEEIELQRTRC